MGNEGVWEPKPSNIKPDQKLLAPLLAEPWPDATALNRLNDITQGHIQRWIALPAAQWQDCLEALSRQQLLHFIQLFTLAEQHLPNCHAEADSAVIPAFKKYRSLLGQPDPELLRWLREQSDNRFIPYGSANL